MEAKIADTVSRFSNRVADYTRWRPSYPREIIPLLEEACGLSTASAIADLGSGTGILTRLFLENGNTVFAVEPNGEMRAAAEQILSPFSKFRSVEGKAEATTLPDQSVDFVTAGQAFHWFDAAAAHREFSRILKPEGRVVLVWNQRRLDSSALLVAYEELLRTWGIDYASVAASYPNQTKLESFFHPFPMRMASFINGQNFDFEGLRGRLLSASYAPRQGHPNHSAMLTSLKRIFEENQQVGSVLMEYDCSVYYGQLG